MTMTGETERELIAAVARIEATTSANHLNLVRDIDRFTTELTRLVTLGEEREKNSQHREERINGSIHGLQEWQIKHPTDPAAHDDLRNLAAAISLQLEEIRTLAASSVKRLDAYESEAKGRSEIWGVQYRGLVIGGLVVGMAGTIIGAFVALGGFG